jgi:hypothetical protein
MEALVTTVTTILSPFVAAIAEQAGKLMARIRDWFTGDQEAETALDSFEKNPNRYSGVLQDLLLEKIRANPGIGEELTRVGTRRDHELRSCRRSRTLPVRP